MCFVRFSLENGSTFFFVLYIHAQEDNKLLGTVIFIRKKMVAAQNHLSVKTKYGFEFAKCAFKKFGKI